MDQREYDKMSEREYEDRQLDLELAIEQARKELRFARGGRYGARAIQNRENALDQALQAYDRFMGVEVE